MEKLTRQAQSAGLVRHPYQNDPDYFSRINFYFISNDQRLASYYWEAPIGRFSMRFEQFDEQMIILEGALRLETESGVETLSAGDCLLISREDGDATFAIIEAVRAIGFVYPIDAVEYGNIRRLIAQAVK